MNEKDFYKSFSEETNLKLEILSNYLEEWLPVFLMGKYIEKIRILDFFCGPGKDQQGQPGSPVVILEVIKKFIQKHIDSMKDRIEIIFNDSKKKHIEELKDILGKPENNIKNVIIKTESLEFEILFDKIEPSLKSNNTSSFIFLNQFGIKEVTKEIFLRLFNLHKTDFMFFISSSSIKRFLEQDEFKDLWWMDNDSIKSSSLKDIHKRVVSEYKKIAPANAYVIPFTIKKGSNVYGLVFCSKHILAADKFLRTAWDKNKINGEANFDINEDCFYQQSLFEKRKLTKIEAFEEEIKKEIINKKITNNKEAYIYAISHGFLAVHVKKIIQKIKKSGVVEWGGKLSLSYDSCIKKGKIISFVIRGGN